MAVQDWTKSEHIQSFKRNTDKSFIDLLSIMDTEIIFQVNLNANAEKEGSALKSERITTLFLLKNKHAVLYNPNDLQTNGFIIKTKKGCKSIGIQSHYKEIEIIEQSESEIILLIIYQKEIESIWYLEPESWQRCKTECLNHILQKEEV